MNKYFVIGMVFEKIETKKIKGKANDFPTSPNGEYNTCKVCNEESMLYHFIKCY